MPFSRATAPAVVDKSKKSVFTSPSDFVKVQAAAAVAMDAANNNAGDTKAASASAKASGTSAVSSANAIVTAVVGSATVTTSLGHEGGLDGTILATKSDTSLRWGSHIGGTGTDTITACVANSLGNITVVGQSVNSRILSVFDSTNLVAMKTIPNPNTGRYVTFITQYSSTGAHLWTAYLGGNHDNLSIPTIGIDSSNNMFIAVTTGNTSNPTVAFNADGSTFASITPVNGTGLVAKISSNGVFNWVDQIYGTVDNTSIIDLCVDTTGAVYVAGFKGGSTTITNITQSDASTYSYTSITSRTNYPFIAKFSNAGMVTGFLQIGGISASNDLDLRRIGTDGLNNVLLVGQVNSASASLSIRDSASVTKSLLPASWPMLSLTSGCYIVKLASDLTWGANGFLTYGASNYFSNTCSIGGICGDSSGNVYVSLYGSYNNGIFVTSSDFPTSGVKMMYFTYTGKAAGEAFIFKLKPNGTADSSNNGTANSWQLEIMGVGGTMSVNNLRIDSTGNFLYAIGTNVWYNHGQSGDNLNIKVLDKATGSIVIARKLSIQTLHTVHDDRCILLVKIPTSFTDAAVIYQFDTAISGDNGADVCIDPSGNVYIVGAQGGRMVPPITINP